MRNVFLYWTGKDYRLINLLRSIIWMYSNIGEGYNVILIDDKNVDKWVNIPSNFYNLLPAHQADYVRVNVICDYGGIWLDSDTLIMDDLNYLFERLKVKDGFFIVENGKKIGNSVFGSVCNGVFGSKPNTPLMIDWKRFVNNKISSTSTGVNGWSDLGSKYLTTTHILKGAYFKEYDIYNGLDTVYPINWDNASKLFLKQPSSYGPKYEKVFQPFIILVGSVYKDIEGEYPNDITKSDTVLSYFINKSLDNLKLKLNDLSFVEIGTSNFDTLIEGADDNVKGISVEPIQTYLNNLPDKANVRKVQAAITDYCKDIDENVQIFYVSESDIAKYNLPDWLKGCNSINDYHPRHVELRIQHLVKQDTVPLISIRDFWTIHRIKKVNYLKIDTEGHDAIILNGLYNHLKELPKDFYPNKIMFEIVLTTDKNYLSDIINKFENMGYYTENKGPDMILHLS